MTLTSEQVAAMSSRAKCLFDREVVEKTLDQLAKQISESLADKDPLFLCVMNGSVIPMGQLLTRLSFPLQIDYIHATRYRGEMKGGDLDWIATPRIPLKGRHVVLVEDILDTGLTLAALVKHCEEAGAEKVYTVALTDKDCERAKDGVKAADFSGLKLPNAFVIGYGLDYQEYFRNLPGIYVLADEDIPG